MKHTPTMDDMIFSFDDMVSILRKHFTNINPNEPEAIKLANEYYKWLARKTQLIAHEKTFQIPCFALPNIIKPYSFQWLLPHKQAIVLKYYQYDNITDKYIISVKKNSVPNEDIELIVHSLVLIRKTVVWVDFGYNIGTEFGGRHPAIILKNLKDSLIVIPLSSQCPKNMDFNVKIDKVYGFSEIPRWANVTRITQISLSRVHFEKFGDVKPIVLRNISEKLKNVGII